MNLKPIKGHGATSKICIWKKQKKAGLVELLDGIRQIYKATKFKKKYKYLLDILQGMGFIILGNSGTFEVPQVDYDLKIVYIQPNNPDEQDNVITYKEVSGIVEKHGDELSLRFSKSLLKWASTKAGEQ